MITPIKLKNIPSNCRECEYALKQYGLIGCKLLRDWIEIWEWEEGKQKLKECPLDKK